MYRRAIYASQAFSEVIFQVWISTAGLCAAWYPHGIAGSRRGSRATVERWLKKTKVSAIEFNEIRELKRTN